MRPARSSSPAAWKASAASRRPSSPITPCEPASPSRCIASERSRARGVRVPRGGTHAPARDQQRGERARRGQRGVVARLGEQRRGLLHPALLGERLDQRDQRLERVDVRHPARVHRGAGVGLGAAQVARGDADQRAPGRGAGERAGGAVADRLLDQRAVDPLGGREAFGGQQDERHVQRPQRARARVAGGALGQLRRLGHGPARPHRGVARDPREHRALPRRVARQVAPALARRGERLAVPGGDEERAEPSGLELQRQLAVGRARSVSNSGSSSSITSGRGPDGPDQLGQDARRAAPGRSRARPTSRSRSRAPGDARCRLRAAEVVEQRERAADGAGGSASARASSAAPTAGAPRAWARAAGVGQDAPRCARSRPARSPAGARRPARPARRPAAAAAPRSR